MWFGITGRARDIERLADAARRHVANFLEYECDFGRKFGWFIEKTGERVGELDYLRWDSLSQFWHEYRVTWCRPEDAVIGPDAWRAEKLVLRNRRYTDILVESFLTAPLREGDVIPVRNAFVPVERIRRDENG